MKQVRLLCTKFHEFIHLHHPLVRIRSHVPPIIPAFYSRKLLELACLIHGWASHGSSSNRLLVQHSTCPAFTWKVHDVASKFPLGITLARDCTSVEQQGIGAVGLRWIETLVCHMHRGSMEVRFLCCNLAVGTLDSQDSASEHQRTTDTRTTCLHLGKGWKKRWKDIAFGKALTTGFWRLLSMVIGCGSKRIFCIFHVAH